MGIIILSSYIASILVFKHLGFQINIHSFSLYFLCFLLSHKSKQFGIFHLFINLCIKSSFLSFIYSSPILSLTMSNSLQDQFMFFVYFPVWNYIFLNFWILQFTISNLFAKVLAHCSFFFLTILCLLPMSRIYLWVFLFFSHLWCPFSFCLVTVDCVLSTIF